MIIYNQIKYWNIKMITLTLINLKIYQIIKFVGIININYL